LWPVQIQAPVVSVLSLHVRPGWPLARPGLPVGHRGRGAGRVPGRMPGAVARGPEGWGGASSGECRELRRFL